MNEHGSCRAPAIDGDEARPGEVAESGADMGLIGQESHWLGEVAARSLAAEDLVRDTMRAQHRDQCQGPAGQALRSKLVGQFPGQ